MADATHISTDSSEGTITSLATEVKAHELVHSTASTVSEEL